MRTSNIAAKNTILSIYFILIVVGIIIVVLFSSFREFSNQPLTTIAIIVAIYVMTFVAIHITSKFFEYDSDGMKVVITNSELFLTDYIKYKDYKAEFRKEELIAFKFKTYIFYKTLTIVVKNKIEGEQKYTFNVSLLTPKKRRYIGQSLSKIVRANKKLKEKSK